MRCLLTQTCLVTIAAFRILVASTSGHGGGFTCGHASEGYKRVVSSADFHGDWVHATEHLKALGIADDGKWIGRDATFVYTGDIVDRGDHGKALWELMFALQDEAPASGGRVVLLLGNHEIMNLQQNLHYVSSGDFRAYGGRSERIRSWAPDGTIGRELRQRGKAGVVVADVVYVHAGLLPKILSEFAPGSSGEDAVDFLNDRVGMVLKGDASAIRSSRSSLLAEEGPFWTRTLTLEDEGTACPLLEKTLKTLKVRRMIVGHTPQRDGNITMRCGGRLLLADTFMSQAYTLSAAASVQNEAAVEFYGNSSVASAVYPKRRDGSCIALPLAPESLEETFANNSFRGPSIEDIAASMWAVSARPNVVLMCAGAGFCGILLSVTSRKCIGSLRSTHQNKLF